MTRSVFDEATLFGRRGYFLRTLILDGDSHYSEGYNYFDRWVVRLGCEPYSNDARMASLHESYHSTLNDCTAYGTLLYVARRLAIGFPECETYKNFFLSTFEATVDCHETYATYASLFIVSQGIPQLALLDTYPNYEPYYRKAQNLAEVFPNDLLGFHLIQALCRCCMQANCLEPLLHRRPADWQFAQLPRTDLPDVRLEMLLAEDTADDAYAHLCEWAQTESTQVRALLDLERGDRLSYKQLIHEDYDAAADSIGLFFYDFIANRLTSAGASCLSFNGHQEWVADLLGELEPVLPHEPCFRPLKAAPSGNVTEDVIIQNFTDERLVISHVPYEAQLYDIDDLEDIYLKPLLTGPEAHGLITVRPARRLVQMYSFPDLKREILEHMENAPVVCLRRRVVTQDTDKPVIEHFLTQSPAALSRLTPLTEQGAFFIGSISLTCLADATWQREWLATLYSFMSLSVLIDMNPFRQIRTWASHDKYDVFYGTINVVDGNDKRHVVYALYPDTGDDIVYLAPCSGIVANALTYSINSMSNSGRLREDKHFLEEKSRSLHYTVSHLLREEPWFDFIPE